MSDPDEVSEAGIPIHRHKARERKSDPVLGDEKSAEVISQHIERYLGRVDVVFHEIVSDLVHVDVHHVPPSEERPRHTLVTSGMSDRPMAAPAEAKELRFAELMAFLPPDWPLSEGELSDERHYWPIRWLKTLARLPHEYNTWLGIGHTIPNGDPPEPFAPTTRLSGIMLMPPLHVPEKFRVLEVSPEKKIHFFALVPLHTDELELKLRKGTDALLDLLDEGGVGEVIDPTRESVVPKRKRWWKM